MTSTLRPIEPIDLGDVPCAQPAGARPQLKWVPPTALLVDATYQRDLTVRSINLITKLVRNFAWNRMKPPIVVQVGPASLHVVDGQHTAIAAATIGLSEIPVFVVSADTTDERARAFVGHNTDRITVTAIQIHNALVASGDPDALEVAEVCNRAGVRIREYSQSSVVAEGDTKAVNAIRRLIGRRGVMRARQVLSCLVKAKRAPIGLADIQAVELIICVDRPTVADHSVLSSVIRMTGAEALAQARAQAIERRSPYYRELAAIWLKRLEQADNDAA